MARAEALAESAIVVLVLMIIVGSSYWAYVMWRDTPKAVTFCQLVADPNAFDGLVVRVEASVLNDPMHAAILVDVRCVGGIGIEVAPERVKRDIDEFLGAVAEAGSGTHIRAHFEGAYVSGGEEYPRLLKLRSVRNLQHLSKSGPR